MRPSVSSTNCPKARRPQDVIKHWLASARADDAKRGVIWPKISPENMAEAGLAWHIFPNMSVLQGVTFALCYRARPYGDDPNKCIFESYALERFPEGQEPKTEWVYAEPTAEKWGSVLAQDFSNMSEVQKGMKSRGFRGTLPNPHQERKVTNFHRNLADYMGTGAPRLHQVAQPESAVFPSRSLRDVSPFESGLRRRSKQFSGDKTK